MISRLFLYENIRIDKECGTYEKADKVSVRIAKIVTFDIDKVKRIIKKK